MSPAELQAYNEKKIEGLYPTIQEMVRKFLDRANVDGYPLRITHGYRSIEEQNALYAQGRTKPGNIVTNAKGGESFHNFGLAIDVYDEVRGYDTDWDVLERIADTVGLEHGDRGYTDLPHFQYRGGLSLQEVQAGKRPNDLNNNDDDMTAEQTKQLSEVYAFIQQLKKGVEPLRQNKEDGSFYYDTNIRQEDPKKVSIWADTQALAALVRAAANPVIDKAEAKNPKYVSVASARSLKN